MEGVETHCSCAVALYRYGTIVFIFGVEFINEVRSVGYNMKSKPERLM